MQNLRKVLDNETIALEEAKGLIRVITDYAQGLNVLEEYDRGDIQVIQKRDQNIKSIAYDVAITEVSRLRVELQASELFGQEMDRGLESALLSIFQSIAGQEIYPNIESKAANLLYLIIKNHPFVDGNKRIGSFMFLRFLEVNGLLYKSDGTRLLETNALVAIALLIAQSNPDDKELMVNLVIRLIS